MGNCRQVPGLSCSSLFNYQLNILPSRLHDLHVCNISCEAVRIDAQDASLRLFAAARSESTQDAIERVERAVSMARSQKACSWRLCPLMSPERLAHFGIS